MTTDVQETARLGAYTARVSSSPSLAGRLGTTWRLLLKELSAFGIVGVVCFFIQVGLFQVLYAHLHVGAVTSNVAANVVSMTVAYFAHRYWSFSHRGRTSMAREYVLFAVINGATVLLGIGLIALVRYGLHQDSALMLQAANIASIVLGTAVRYVGYRQWVFPAQDKVPDHAATGPALG
jgi:putative flippase GtrA